MVNFASHIFYHSEVYEYTYEKEWKIQDKDIKDINKKNKGKIKEFIFWTVALHIESFIFKKAFRRK